MFFKNMNEPKPKLNSGKLYPHGYPDHTERVPLEYTSKLRVPLEDFTEYYSVFIRGMFERGELFLHVPTKEEKEKKLHLTNILKKLDLKIKANYDLSIDRSGPEYMFMFSPFHDEGWGDLLIGSDEEVLHSMPNMPPYREVPDGSNTANGFCQT